MKKIKILIADDHKLVREACSYLLNNDERLEIVAECESGERAVELCHKLHPEVAIIDINLPGISGFEATKFIRKFSPGTKVLAVSMHTDPFYAKKMFQKGASGYVTKNSPVEEMIKAILTIRDGESHICQEIKNILATQMETGRDTQKDIESLSQRELEVVSFVKKGSSSKEIADALKISERTVEVHRYNVLKKLKLKNTAALVNFIHSRNLGNEHL